MFFFIEIYTVITRYWKKNYTVIQKNSVLPSTSGKPFRRKPLYVFTLPKHLLLLSFIVPKSNHMNRCALLMSMFSSWYELSFEKPRFFFLCHSFESHLHSEVRQNLWTDSFRFWFTNIKPYHLSTRDCGLYLISAFLFIHIAGSYRAKNKCKVYASQKNTKANATDRSAALSTHAHSLQTGPIFTCNHLTNKKEKKITLKQSFFL